MTLRDYQLAGKRDIYREWQRGAKGVLYVGVTGSGKTMLGTSIVQDVIAQGHHVTWVAHREELLKQARDTLQEFYKVPASICAPGYDFDPTAPVHVASVQTILSRGTRWTGAEFTNKSLTVLDEGHHYGAAEWKQVANVPGRILGLTATPERSDGKPLQAYDALVAGPSYSELIDKGHIVTCKVFRPDEALARGIAQDPVAAYQEHGEGKQGFVFAPSVAVAQEWAQAYREADIPADVIDKDTKSDERKVLMRQFREKRLRLLVNVFVLTEGVDVPAAEVCVLGRGVGHVSPYLQMVGRVLRSAPDKSHGILIDLPGVSWDPKLGLPTQDREYSLTEGITNAPAQPGEPSLRVCTACGLTLKSGQPCPCGYKPEQKLTRPTIYDMALREVCPDDVQHESLEKKMQDLKLQRLLTKWRASRGVPVQAVIGEYRRVFGVAPDLSGLPEAEKRKEYDAWMRQAKERGHNAGWIQHRFRTTFGHWAPKRWRASGA